MKKLLLIAVSSIFLVSVVSAQAQNPAPKKINAPLIEKTQGKINVIMKANAASGDLGGFAVLADGGKAKEFKLIAKTRFFSSASAPIAFADLKKGDKVNILYVVTLKGENDVITVTQIK